ncbi:MAG: PEP-CTERM system histidine kinase PrsK [Pseudomonadales bacterium]|nr:PEP-CTERM system histidine kinase PrsK [Pseudomonadales bacterium]
MRRSSDKALLWACAITTFWMLALACQSVYGYPSFHLRYGLELCRNIAWVFVLVSIFQFEKGTSDQKLTGKTLKGAIFFFYALLLVFLVIEGFFAINLISGTVLLAGQITSSVIGLMLLELAWRNASVYGRTSAKYLCVSLIFIFGYDFFLYSDALLFGMISSAFWDARGAVNSLVAPLIAITLINSRKQPVEVQVSRQIVFHTSTLFLAGVYLLLISTGGYYIRAFGGTWGEALQTLFFSLAALILILLISSKPFRARVMLFISKNFFDYKYDYREEWLKSTHTLTNQGDQSPLEERVIRVISGLVESHSGALWLKDEDNNLALECSVNFNVPKHNTIHQSSEIVRYFEQNNWIIDLAEYGSDPTKYNFLDVPDCITNTSNPWLIVPLYASEELHGFVVISEPVTKVELNWENYDLIKVVSSQACSFLAQNLYQEKLAQSKQFEAVNRTSAFMVHDLKTIIAQLSLLTQNAHKFKNNPAFVDDMIKTTEHTVDKMQHLLQQIRNPQVQHQTQSIELVALLKRLVEAHGKWKPQPVLSCTEKMVHVRADNDQLYAVIGHILQNAQDATPKDGEVTINLKKNKGMAYIFIQDNGSGMSEDFIKHQLFKPFVSTKGLTGMGIGAYQSREYLKRLGGNIEVTSQINIGTCFTLHIPLDFRQGHE